MDNEDFVLLIMNCYNYREKAEKQRETWLKTIPRTIKFYHVIGDIEKCIDENKEYIFDNDNNVLYVKTKDDYNSLPSKVINAFQAVSSTLSIKYIFKTDDDQNLVVGDFFEKLIDKLTDSCFHYGGYSVKVKNHFSNYHRIHECLPKRLFLKACLYCSGRFYLLSKDAVANLLTKKEEICGTIIEDHAIGLHLDAVFGKEIFHIETGLYFKDMGT